MRNTGERLIPWNRRGGWHTLYQHVCRYAWAIPFVFDKRVADLGCGTGYGTLMLSWAAASAVGVDVDPQAIGFARRHFGAETLSFEVGDITQSQPDADLYVCFEVLEHLDDPLPVVEALPGPLVYSIPVSDNGRFHTRAYEVEEIKALFGGDIWYQFKGGGIVPEVLCNTLQSEASQPPMFVLGWRE